MGCFGCHSAGAVQVLSMFCSDSMDGVVIGSFSAENAVFLGMHYCASCLVWVPRLDSCLYVRLGSRSVSNSMSICLSSQRWQGKWQFLSCSVSLLCSSYQMLPARVYFRIVSSWSVKPCRFHSALQKDAAVPWCSCLGTILGPSSGVFFWGRQTSLFFGWSVDAGIVVFQTQKSLRTDPELTLVQ